MIILPAIDIYGGAAVRLLRGDFEQMTVYDSDPVAVARRMKKAGARHIHIVDLEGAKAGKPVNFDIIAKIIADTGLLAEVGGGIRDAGTVRAYIEAGAARVILGTAAATAPGFAAEMASLYGDKIAAGADCRDGMIAVRGWLETASVSRREFFTRMQDAGVKTIIYTDISRDGALRGIDAAVYRDATAEFPDLRIIASGGVTSISDIIALRDTGVYGVIIGRAYYTGVINLKEAIQIGEGTEKSEVV
jgi:phosphoribosylformimino-5-aminoimidazole carboxamide ribotide isomerase